MDGFSLHGRRALVTGSSEGIGAAIADALEAAGARVVRHGVEAGPPGARHEVADFADPGAIDRLIAAAGDLDILVSNVAVQVRQPLAAIDAAAIDLQVAVNLKAALRLFQAVLPGMRARRWGRIVAIGSVQESVPHPQMLIYAGLKAAQANIVRNLAAEVAADGVTVNAIAPGVIVTRRNAEVLGDADYAETVRARVPMGHFGMPGDIAGAAVLLCSEAGRYITGINLAIDGGMHL